jgi:hypothetical protein
MSSKTLAPLALALCGLLACSSNETKTAAPAPAPAVEPAPEETPVETPPAEEPYELFGAKLANREEVAFETLLADPAAYRGKKIITTGVVRQNCQKRGCWMDVRPQEDRAALSLTVRFLDYEFFVPLDSRGARVRMEGVTKVTTLTAEEVKHMEDEGAVVQGKKPDGTADSVEFTASGVEMRGRKK